MFRPEPLDLLLILLAAVLLFGASRLPETARAIGKAIREFRNAVLGKDDDVKEPAAEQTAQNETRPS